ncbi:MAG: hypothetical protein KA314_10450 [Chloroflexi bacterium]|nr:hypothetical protein [Chloroflexota bacterium]MBP8056254.1 hypothetical protein [Chloroflexota bacterium]
MKIIPIAQGVDKTGKTKTAWQTLYLPGFLMTTKGTSVEKLVLQMSFLVGHPTVPVISPANDPPEAGYF